MVRVGVTGHRTIRDPERVARRVRDGLHGILRLTDAGDGAGPARLEIVAALAEGADRLVAREALALPGTTLAAVLPFPADDEGDVETPEARAGLADLLERAHTVEVMPTTTTREAGYALQGRWVVDHSDVLVAVWDGERSRGQGGTAEIVAYAADRGVLLLWVRASRA
ncbi:hypothetical protein [Humibacillus xanthopallidus]|uniref:hypothetical protein n=1 Tax=Humibacillus xanthopallidus TaxID=412689 RepID=UPI0016397DA5|nr:hypothetical protein [Humibacillus xanthopallidus]